MSRNLEFLRSFSEVDRSEETPNVLINNNVQEKPREFFTISETSADDSSVVSCGISVSTTARTPSTISLKSLDGSTIDPESFVSPDEDEVRNKWILVGQPDHPAQEDLHVNIDHSTTAEEEEEEDLFWKQQTDIDFDRQKKCADVHIRRRLEAIKRYLENMEFCDFALNFGKSTTPTHAMMFRAHEGFATKFPQFFEEQGGGNKIKAMNLDVYGYVTAAAFGAIMRYTYDGQCEVTYENLAEVVTAVEYFGITTLEEEINKTVELILKDENLLPICFHGDPEHPLHDLAWARVLERIQFVVKLGDFVALEIAEICRILNLDGLAFDTEYIAFEIARSWIIADPAKRNIHFAKIMKCVRFHYMTPDELAAAQKTETMLTTCRQIADVVTLAYISRQFVLENDLEFLENFELLPPRNLTILRHFTVFNDEENQEFCFYPATEETFDFQVARSPRKVEETLPHAKQQDNIPARHQLLDDSATMEGVGELPDDGRQDITSAEDFPHNLGCGVDTCFTLGTKPKAKSDHGLFSTRSSIMHNDKNESVAVVSPSFSDMTFNRNGSLVTKRGGKLAHKTLNKAFERIYERTTRHNLGMIIMP